MKIGVIGAGISGLSSALFLADRGHQVTVFQQGKGIGGLLETIDLDGTPTESFYHFLCNYDLDYFDLCDRLGIGNRVNFKNASAGFYFDGKYYRFNSPLDLLRFSPIPFFQRIRFGLFILEARLRQEWKELDQQRAIPWLTNRLGQRAYDVIWDPFLALKFGSLQNSISAAWIWHRVHRVAGTRGKYGYLHGGSGLLLDHLMKALKDSGVALLDNTSVTIILEEEGRITGLKHTSGQFSCDQVVSTVPMPVLADLLPPGWKDYEAELHKIRYIGVACAVFKLAHHITNDFWMSVNDAGIPFNSIVEYTNLFPYTPEDGHIVYVPYHVPVAHEFYKMNDEALLEMTWRGICKIAPHLTSSDVRARQVTRTPYAQPVCQVDFLSILPKQRAPIQGLHLLDSIFCYPQSPTQSGQILLASELARRIGTDI